MTESFPCIICGRQLERVHPDTEGQPDNGLMCMAYGKYGSTVFDAEDLSYLAFNICDECMVEKAEQGRVMVTRNRIPIEVDGLGQVGYERVDRPYVAWHRDMPSDDARIDLDVFQVGELNLGRPQWVLTTPLDVIKQRLEGLLLLDAMERRRRLVLQRDAAEMVAKNMN